MLRIVDLQGAIAARGWPIGLDATVDLEVQDPQAPWSSGRWQVTFAHGEAQAVAGGSGAVRATIGAIAALYTCAYDTQGLVRAGLLSGPDDLLRALDAAFAGPESMMWDYF